ncbi:unnamed protein product [Ectocarpus sp. 12 AP-2014]
MKARFRAAKQTENIMLVMMVMAVIQHKVVKTSAKRTRHVEQSPRHVEHIQRMNSKRSRYIKRRSSPRGQFAKKTTTARSTALVTPCYERSSSAWPVERNSSF